MTAVADRYRVLLVTKGDLLDLERKLVQSGLGDVFDEVEIVSDKTPVVYHRIFVRHDDGADAAMMVGNSMKSDIVPAIGSGAWAVHVPHDLAWPLKDHALPAGHPSFREIESLHHLPELLGF